MVIKFTCPKGHTLSCSEDRIGQSGKCPKCGEKFVVPGKKGEAADGSDAAADSSAKSGPKIAEGSGPKPVAGEEEAKRPDEQIIVFLCPNGHKLNGPARLAGHPGQCPHCSAKFRIPTQEDLEEDADEDAEETPVDEIPVGTLVEDGDDLDLEDVEEIEEFEEIEELAGFPDESGFGHFDQPAVVGAIPPPIMPHAEHALAVIFMQLWNQRGEDGVVEIRLKDGDPIEPEYFSPGLSQGAFGVFGVKAEDSTFTLTTVPWDSITQIVVKQVEDLPGGFSE